MDLQREIESLLRGGILEETTRIRRHLHQYPELSFQEHQTSAFIRQLLDQWGIAYEFPFAETGILARMEGKGPGPVLALRADMDALPIQENSSLEFSSLNPGVMHACGHDIHTSCLLGSIRIIQALRQEIQGTLLFVFQPGEEKLPGGAKLMLEQGLFEKIKPDLILAQHVLPEMKAGQVGFKPGPYMASSDEIYITVEGKGGHGALRKEARDPILMASRILLELQDQIREHQPSGIPTILSFGKVLADGAVNVIPDQVHLEGTFRTMDASWRKEGHQLITRTATEICRSKGGRARVEIRHGYPELHNHEKLTRIARQHAVDYLGSDQVIDMDTRMTAEDFAWYTRQIPGMLYRLGVGDPDSDQVPALHTPAFVASEKALETGIGFLSYLALELLKKMPV